MLDAKTSLVPIGTVCYGSVMKDSNRWTPSEELCGVFNSDAVVRPLRWVSDRKGLIAVFAKRAFISELELVSSAEEAVVWVSSDSIQKW